MPSKTPPLTNEQKLEIRRLYAIEHKTQKDIAVIFGKTPLAIHSVCADDTLKAFEDKMVAKEEQKWANRISNKSKDIVERLVNRLEKQIDKETDVRKLVDGIEKLGKYINVLEGRPTEIKEERRVSVDLNKLLEMSTDKQLEYLLKTEPVEADFERVTEQHGV